MKFADDSGYSVCCGTKGSGERDIQGSGIAGGHAYSIISVHEKEGAVPRLMKLRNPWGKTEWNGAYSDNSHLWTQELKEKLGHSNEDDGEFFMPFNEYLKYFDHTCIVMKVRNDYKIKNLIYDGVNNRQ